MSLKLVIGPSGSGKSTHLYQNLIAESEKNRERNYIVLVPEQFTMQTQRELVMMHPCHGIMNIDVLSFGRLAYRIFQELGVDLKILDDEGKNLILRKVAQDCAEDLIVLRGNLKKQGYISEIKSVLSEFTQYDISDEELEQVMEAAPKESRLYYKLQDLRRLYQEFNAFIENRYITKEELLGELGKRISASGILKDSEVVLDGFTGFTPVQLGVIRELLLVCRKVTVTVTMDEREAPFEYTHPYQMFALGKHTISGLKKLAKNCAVDIDEPNFLFDKPPKRFERNEEMAFLEHHLFRTGNKAYKGPAVNSISMCVSINPKEEARNVAAQIRALVREKGYRYKEIGVIMGNVEDYQDDLAQAFELYDIPGFLDQKRNILSNPYVESLRSLLQIMMENYSRDSVLRHLRTKLFDFTQAEVDYLENYILEKGIRGYSKWNEEWKSGTRGMKDWQLQSVNKTRAGFVARTQAVKQVSEKKKKTVRDMTRVLYEFMLAEDFQNRLKKQEAEFEKAGDQVLAKEYAQVYRAIIELFDKLVLLLGDEYVTLEEYARLLDAGLEEVRIGVIPSGNDQVVTGDLERTRLNGIKVLFLMGANDAYLPGNLTRTGLLSERDRELFGKEELALAPCGKERAYTQKYYLYLNMTKPSDELYLSYSKMSSEGASMRPSYLVQEILKLFPQVRSGMTGVQKQKWEDELSPKSGVVRLIHGMQDDSCMSDDRWKELYAWYAQNEEWRPKIDRIIDAAFARYQPETIQKEVARALYDENFNLSITRSEKFSACACAQFLTYGLKLREQKEYEFQPADLGNVCHDALERYGKRLQAEGKRWSEVTPEVQKKYIQNCMEEAIQEYSSDILQSSEREGYRAVQMTQMMEQTIRAITRQLAAGEFEPMAYEMAFPGGKIDRLDVCEDENRIYVKVQDYKTGKKEFDLSELYYGLQVQMVVYMREALKALEKKYQGTEKTIIPAGVLYYQIQNPVLDKSRIKEKGYEEAVQKALRTNGILNSDEQVLEKLDAGKEGDSLVIPVGYTKSGELKKTSSVISKEDFDLLIGYGEKLTEEIREKILNGVADVMPFEKDARTGCDYCPYSFVCGFDPKIQGYRYRELEKVSKEDVLARIRKEGQES